MDPLSAELDQVADQVPLLGRPVLAEARRAKRDEQREMVTKVAHTYNPGAVVVVGPPFGHTRPQWIVPYGGFVTVDGVNRRVSADYS